MSTKIETIEGLFGEKIHYENGVKVGESWPGLFGGSYNHYDANGNYVGESMPGVFADQVHYDACGRHTGSSMRGIFMTHTIMDDGTGGETIDTLLGSESFLDFDPFE